VHSGLEWVFSLPKISKLQKKIFLKLVHSTPKRREKKIFFLENEIFKIFVKISTKIGQNQLFFAISANIA